MGLLLLAVFAAVASFAVDARAQAVIESALVVTPFSFGHAESAPPAGWEALRITEGKRPTTYRLVADQGVVVLHARADSAASALAHRTAFDVRAAPVVEWRWRISRLIDGADNRIAAREDSPVRLMFEFDGDKSRLSLSDRTVFLVSRAASGNELPYATLMYVWSNTLPVGTVVPNPHTRRIQMVVASSGAGDVGQWVMLKRNLHDDFVRAFGEAPGKLTAVGVLTDTDNTGQSTQAWYGDVRFGPADR